MSNLSSAGWRFGRCRSAVLPARGSARAEGQAPGWQLKGRRAAPGDGEGGLCQLSAFPRLGSLLQVSRAWAGRERARASPLAPSPCPGVRPGWLRRPHVALFLLFHTKRKKKKRGGEKKIKEKKGPSVFN